MEMMNLLVIIFLLAACNAKQITRCDDPQSADCPTSPFFGGGAVSSDVKITSLKPLVAKPGQEVLVRGANLKKAVELRVGDEAVSLTVLDDGNAKFIMPSTPRAGAFAITVKRTSGSDGVVDAAAKFVLSDSAADAYPIYMAAPEEICSPKAFRDAEGELRLGTKNCGAATIDPWDLRVGVTVGNVTGKLKVNCRNRANLSIQDMDAGISVTGISNNVLTTAQPHELTANQPVRLHYTTAPTGADNMSTYYVKFLSPTEFSIVASSGESVPLTIDGGSGITVHRWQDGTADVWDTIDDDNFEVAGPPSLVVPGWSGNDCGGIDTPETTSDDDNVWKDVTTSDGVVASNCLATPANCTMQDKITGLWWSHMLEFRATWVEAIQKCDAAELNGRSDWRLPTQKELMEAYNHNIHSAISGEWIDGTQIQDSFWSSSTLSYDTSEAWLYAPTWGESFSNSKNLRIIAVCVRP